jgi:Icc-related predicted phosphoesterase
MKLCLISDTHERHRELNIDPCDVLIHAGDFTNLGSQKAHYDFVNWFENQPAKYKCLIGGNHDLHLHSSPYTRDNFILDIDEFKKHGIVYLKDSWVDIHGIRIYGSPWTPKFGDWAFMKPRESIGYYWDMIPYNVDILITHGPAYGILDQPWGDQEHVGCKALLDTIMKVKPRYHVSGHVHGSYGEKQFNGVTFLNVSSCGENYKVQNKPVYIEV